MLNGLCLVFMGTMSAISASPYILMDANAPLRTTVNFHAFRKGAISEFRLQESEPGWGPAIRAWRTRYLPQSEITDENRKSAEKEIERLEGLASERLIRHFKQAHRKTENDNQRSEALEDLKALRARFRGSKAVTVLEKHIKDLER